MNRRTKSARPWAFLDRGFLALAVVALAVLVLQPICDAHEVDAGDPAACCASMVDVAPAASVPAASPAGEPSPAAAFAQPPLPRPMARRILAAAPRGHPFACPPYHVRSARNLS